MTEELTITEGILEDEVLGPLAQAFFNLEFIGTNIEHREQMAKNYWDSLTDEDLRIIADDEEGMLIATVAMKSIFESENPLSFQAIYTLDQLEVEAPKTSLVAGLELLRREGIVEWDGTYFYNPFEDDTLTTGMYVPDKVKFQTTEDKLDALL